MDHLALQQSDNEGWLEIKKVTVFVGNQGSRKNTIAKLISTFTWIEKVLTRGDFKEKEFTASKFRNKYCGNHRISSYFNTGRTEIEYKGDSYNFTYTKEGEFTIEKNTNALSTYPLPQIMYVPAECNFISIVNNPSMIKELPDSLLTFLSEYNKAKSIIKGDFTLPINDALLEYTKTNDTVSVKGGNYKVKLQEASSGFQSIVPLYLIFHFEQEEQSQAFNVKKAYIANSCKPHFRKTQIGRMQKFFKETGYSLRIESHIKNL